MLSWNAVAAAFVAPRTMAFRNPTNLFIEDRRFDWRVTVSFTRKTLNESGKNRSCSLVSNNGQRAVPDDEDPEQNMKERARDRALAKKNPPLIVRSLHFHWKL
jgi:hypothetical protein